MTSAKLKYVAIITMLIDHIGAFILEDVYGLNSTIYILSRSLGRIAFPIFVFLLVEGFKKTKNIKKYFINLLIFAFISEIPFDLVHNGTIFDPSHQNIFFTLLAGLIMLILIDRIRIKRENIKIITEIFIVILFSLLSMVFRFDYSFFAPLVFYSYYKFYVSKKIRFL
ncbi:MAG: TraX family protein [Peptoniphilus sp.]